MLRFVHIALFCLAVLSILAGSGAYAQSISGFSPQSISAGTESQLTITGSGFGTGGAGSTRHVEFPATITGGTGYTPAEASQYISWADNQIVVKVPSNAGTGSFRIVTNGVTVTAASSLIVTFNILNQGTLQRRHVNRNGIGGYTFRLESSFSANAAAKNAIAKSMKAWVCQSTINLQFGAITDITTSGNDGTNVIRFDTSSDPLPAGVLADAFISSANCGGNNWEIRDIDIVFDKEANWNYSNKLPTATQADFQSAALRVLGRAHNLGYVIDPADIMHMELTPGTARRNFSTSNIAASTYQMNLSKVRASGFCTAALVPLQLTNCATPFPEVDSISPSSVGRRGIVRIIGEFLTGTSLITFGGTIPESFSIKSDNLIEAKIGTGSTGDMMLTTPGGTFTVSGFVFREPPDIVSFSPQFGFAGDTISIAGFNFGGTNLLEFGGVPAASFEVVDIRNIKAVLAGGNTGNIKISTDAGTDSVPGFTYTGTVAIQSVVPLTGVEGDTIIINGSNFKAIKSVKFGGISAASYELLSVSSIRAILGKGATGSVSLTSDFGSASFPGFTFVAPPLISSLNPPSAAEGSIVKINGANFTNASEVKFGGKPAFSFVVNSPELITAVVGDGESGPVFVKGPGGEVSKDGFTFIETLRLLSFTPAIGTNETKVVIKGSKFRNVVQVSFGGVPARSFKVDSLTQISAVVGTGGSGEVSVRTAEGTISKSGFKFLLPPTISGFTPTNAGFGSTVQITGANLDEITSVKFGGVDAASFKMLSSSSVQAVVATGASGSVSLETAVGKTDVPGFLFVPPPVISKADPALGGGGAVINIFGEYLLNAQSISIGSTPVASFTVISVNQITAIVGINTTEGKLTITTPGGTVVSDVFKFLPRPVITSFAPQNAIAGVEVIITGSNFSDISGVSFGGKPATSFQLVSPNVIRAIVPAGSSSGAVSVVNSGGTGSLPGFTFNFTLPSGNFTVAATDLTCKGTMNGNIKITAVANLKYIATLTGNGLSLAYGFTNVVEFKNFAAGTYTICVTIEGESTFKRCFEVTIREPKDLALFSSINQKENLLNLKLEGAETYFIKLNGDLIKTSLKELELNLKPGTNSLTVYTDKLCQGVIEKFFEIGSGVQIFPNPFENVLNIILGTQYSGNVKVEVRNIQGQIMYSGNHTADSNPIVLNLPELVPGTYMVQVTSKDHRSVQKVLKR